MKNNNKHIERLVNLASTLSKGKPREIFTGGTSAITVRINRHGNLPDSVIKLATSDGAGLNNGRRKLIREARQITYLRNKYSKLINNLIPEVINTWEGDDYAAVEYPYYTGNTFANLLRQKDSISLNKILERIINATISTYLLNYKKSNFNLFLEQRLLARAKFRLKYTQRSHSILKDLINQDKIIINGESYINTRILIDRLEDKIEQLQLLRSYYLSDCIHGDLNLRNVHISQDNNIRFLDLRGSRQRWDIFYDLAKIIFTAGFDRICHFEFTPHIKSKNIFGITYADKENSIHDKWERIQCSIEDLYESNKDFITIINNEHNWRRKLRFAHSIHYLADCACRVESGSPLNQAFSSYLLGTIYLNRLFNDWNAEQNAEYYYSLKSTIK